MSDEGWKEHDIEKELKERTIASFEVESTFSEDKEKRETIKIELLKSTDRMKDGSLFPPYLAIGGDWVLFGCDEIPELFKIFKKLNKIYKKLKKTRRRYYKNG